MRSCWCEINVLLGSSGSFISMCFLVFLIIIDTSIKNYEKECYNHFHKMDILKSMWRIENSGENTNIEKERTESCGINLVRDMK